VTKRERFDQQDSSIGLEPLPGMPSDADRQSKKQIRSKLPS
jgi:hypothetical protein